MRGSRIQPQLPGLSVLLEVVVLASCLFTMTLADCNVTVDDSDGSISYSAGWSVSDASNPLDHGGFHHLSSSTTATATFTFVGTAVYVVCPLWPYAVGALAAVDGSEPVGIDMQDYSHTTDVSEGGSEDVASSALWKMDGLSNSSHTLQISFWNIKMYVALDAIIYTVENSTETSSSPAVTPSSSSSSNSESVSKGSTKSKTGIIAGAVVGSLVLASLIFSLVYFFNRRRGNLHSNNVNGGPPTSFIGNTGNDRETGGTPSTLENRKLGYLPGDSTMLPFPMRNQVAYANGSLNTRSYHSPSSSSVTSAGVAGIGAAGGVGGADVLGPSATARSRTGTPTSFSYSGYSPGQHGEISQYRGINHDLPDPVARWDFHQAMEEAPPTYTI